MSNNRKPFVEALQRGETVQFRCNGNSMTPRMHKGDLLTIEPIVDYTTIERGDAVFCKVRKMLTVHKVTGIDGKAPNMRFLISNNHGHDNGWTNQEHVYGKLTKVEKGAAKQ